VTAPLRVDPAAIKVALGDRSYDIVIGRGLIASLGARVAALRPRAKAAVVTDENVARHHLATVEAALAGAGMAASRVIVPDGEGSKSFRVFEQVCEAVIAARIERGDLVVALAAASSAILPASLRPLCAADWITCRFRLPCWRRSIPRSAVKPRSIPAMARI
jgi:hypothetical protein